MSYILYFLGHLNYFNLVFQVFVSDLPEGTGNEQSTVYILTPFPPMKTPATLNTSNITYAIERFFGEYYVSPIRKKVKYIFGFTVSLTLEVS